MFPLRACVGRYMLYRLAEFNKEVVAAYEDFNFSKASVCWGGGAVDRGVNCALRTLAIPPVYASMFAQSYARAQVHMWCRCICRSPFA